MVFERLLYYLSERLRGLNTGRRKLGRPGPAESGSFMLLVAHYSLGGIIERIKQKPYLRGTTWDFKLNSYY